MTFDELAASVARAWAAPRKHPPGCPLEYVAEKAYWQAQNMHSFPGSLEEWCKLCAAKVGDGEAVSPQPAAQVAPPPPALEEWLR